MQWDVANIVDILVLVVLVVIGRWTRRTHQAINGQVAPRQVNQDIQDEIRRVEDRIMKRIERRFGQGQAPSMPITAPEDDLERELRENYGGDA